MFRFRSKADAERREPSLEEQARLRRIERDALRAELDDCRLGWLMHAVDGAMFEKKICELEGHKLTHH